MELPQCLVPARPWGCEMTLLSKQPDTPSVHSPAAPGASRERSCPPQRLGEGRKPSTPTWIWAQANRPQIPTQSSTFSVALGSLPGAPFPPPYNGYHCPVKQGLTQWLCLSSSPSPKMGVWG